MDECEGEFDNAAGATNRCENCGQYLRDHYWYNQLFDRI